MSNSTNKILTFSNMQDAYDWMEEQVADPCVDNYRFAWTDDQAEMAMYDHKRGTGCCGFFDATVIIDGREAQLGCNYGH